MRAVTVRQFGLKTLELLGVACAAAITAGALLLVLQIKLETKWIVAFAAALCSFWMIVATGRVDQVLYCLFFLLIPINPDVTVRDVPMSAIGAQAITISATDLLLIALYVIWLVQRMSQQESEERLWPPGATALVLLIGWAGLSIFNARDPSLGINLLVEMTKSFMYFFYVADRVKTRKDLKTVVICLMIGVVLESLFAFAQYKAGSPLGLDALGERSHAKEMELEDSNIFRVGGTLGHPNALGGYLAAVLPVAMAMCMAAVSNRDRLIYLGASLLGAVTMVLTFCRSAWVAIALAVMGLGGWLLGDRSRRGRMVPVLGVGILMCLVLAAFTPLIIARMTDNDKGSTMSRVPQYKVALTMIKAHPILGVGLNNYTRCIQLYETYVGGDRVGMVFTFQGRVHSIYLLTVGESGLPMLLFLGWFVWIVVRRGWRKIHEASDDLVHLALMGMWLGFGARFLHDGFHTGNLIENPFLWIYSALLISPYRFDDEEAPPAEAPTA